MQERLHLALYRALCRCYPRAFRNGYGEDLLTTFTLQLRELGPLRCWVRTLRDLTVTVPAQHLERHMSHLHRSTPAWIATACLAVGVASTMAAVVTGTSVYGIGFLLVAGAAFVLATMARRAARPALALERSSAWKKFLAAGVVLPALIVVVINQPGAEDRELSSAGWSLMMASFLVSFTLIGFGVVLGVAQRFRRPSG